MERLVRFSENGGIVANREVQEVKTKQKNYVLNVDVANGIKELSKSFKVSESRMIEEMYYTFQELLERGKATETKPEAKAKTEVKADTKQVKQTTKQTKKDK